MNKTLLILTILLIASVQSLSAQVGMNTETPDASAVLDVRAYQNDKGLLIPRMTTAQKLAIVNPAPGLLVYDTDYNCISQYKDTPSNPGTFGWTCQTLFNRHFIYMPSINIPTSTATGALLTGTRTVNLYTAYQTNFSTPLVKSTGAPDSVPYFNRNQLHFYVTYCDPCITITGISDTGILSYTVKSRPNYNAFVNIVFLVR